jgi:hypothetical protein
MKKCPQCGTINPDHAVSCECLFNLTGVLPERQPSAPSVGIPSLGLFEVLSAESPLLGWAGIASVAIGLYMLLISPSATATGDVVNLQKLTIGETFTICGVILIAAQWRPR